MTNLVKNILVGMPALALAIWAVSFTVVNPLFSVAVVAALAASAALGWAIRRFTGFPDDGS